ncbi:MAG: TetR/AcrR family transcriptional regulator [Gammaproteobacteria bacterium]|jgi:AcrR family transcriptional regulator|nr:TetR/AcrR family transcriptional regulator [Gammaproteobacteria bacterium]
MSSENVETRSRILDATVRMLEEHGGRGVRMGDIAKAAGISRQAVYLHFASRAELLVAATRYLDEVLNLDRRLAPSRAATSGIERLTLYIDFWGHYIPEIYGVAKALLLAQDTDQAAAAAWNDRMLAMRDGCRAAVEALRSDGILAPEWTPKRATDTLWTMLLVPNWENLTIECGWSTRQYVRWMKTMAKRTFTDESE